MLWQWLPFVLSGVTILAMWLAGVQLSVASMVGFITLFGIAFIGKCVCVFLGKIQPAFRREHRTGN